MPLQLSETTRKIINFISHRNGNKEKEKKNLEAHVSIVLLCCGGGIRLCQISLAGVIAVFIPSSPAPLCHPAVSCSLLGGECFQESMLKIFRAGFDAAYGEGRRRLAEKMGRAHVDAITSHPTIKYSSKYLSNTRGQQLFTHCLAPRTIPAKATVMLLHGMGGHSCGSQLYLAMRLAEANFSVVSLDYEGHGKSDGLHCYIPCFDSVVEDCLLVLQKTASTQRQSPIFLLGESMGGMVGVNLALRVQQSRSLKAQCRGVCIGTS